MGSIIESTTSRVKREELRPLQSTRAIPPQSDNGIVDGVLNRRGSGPIRALQSMGGLSTLSR